MTADVIALPRPGSMTDARFRLAALLGTPNVDEAIRLATLDAAQASVRVGPTNQLPRRAPKPKPVAQVDPDSWAGIVERRRALLADLSEFERAHPRAARYGKKQVAA